MWLIFLHRSSFSCTAYNLNFNSKAQLSCHQRAIHETCTVIPTLGTIHKQDDGWHCPKCAYVHKNKENFLQHNHISTLINRAKRARSASIPDTSAIQSASPKRPHSPSPHEPPHSRRRTHSPEREMDIDWESAPQQVPHVFVPDTPEEDSGREPADQPHVPHVFVPDTPEENSDDGSEFHLENMLEPAIHQSHDLIRPPALAALQLGIDPVHHLVICEGHGYAVLQKDLASHFQHSPEHKGQHLPPDIEDILDAHNVVRSVTRPTGLIAPIQSIPPQPGFRCIQCNYATLQLNSITKNHLYKEHPGQQAKELIQPCVVQVVFGLSHVEHVWAVEPLYSTIATGNQDSVHMLEYLKAKEEEMHVADVIQAPADPRQTSTFLRRFQWLAATDNHPYCQLHALSVKPDKKKNEFTGLAERVGGYFD